MADEEAPKAKTQDQLLLELKERHSCKIVHSQMPSTYEQDAMFVCLSGVDKYKALKDIAQYIKQEYDKKYPSNGKATDGVYHCVVGKSFASAISHETRHSILLKVDVYHILLWKSKDSPFHASDA